MFLTTPKQSIGVLIFCALYWIANICFVLYSSTIEARIMARGVGVFSWGNTFLIWAVCYLAAAVFAYLDQQQIATQSQNTTQPILLNVHKK